VSAGHVVIHYHRLPDRYERFEQHLVHRTNECVVTLVDATNVKRTIMIDGEPALEPGASVVWFTFRDAWHDIGRFHTLGDRFTGFYANVLTPVDGFDTDEWRTTDLFLDVWQAGDGGGVRILDEDELAEARAVGSIDEARARRAEQEAAAIAAAARADAWPPAIVAEWTLERARGHVRRQQGVR